jgi:hypothetical protein
MGCTVFCTFHLASSSQQASFQCPNVLFRTRCSGSAPEGGDEGRRASGRREARRQTEEEGREETEDRKRQREDEKVS